MKKRSVFWTSFGSMALVGTVLVPVCYPWTGGVAERGLVVAYYWMSVAGIALYLWIPITALVSWLLSKRFGKPPTH